MKKNCHHKDTLFFANAYNCLNKISPLSNSFWDDNSALSFANNTEKQGNVNKVNTG